MMDAATDRDPRSTAELERATKVAEERMQTEAKALGAEVGLPPWSETALECDAMVRLLIRLGIFTAEELAHERAALLLGATEENLGKLRAARLLQPSLATPTVRAPSGLHRIK